MRLGVDVGGTWLRAALSDGKKVLKRGKVPSARPFKPAPALRKLLASWGAPKLDALVLGSTGIWSPAEKRRLAAELKPLARRVTVLSDVELAHRAAFGGGPGVLLLGGTGSIALARGTRGGFVRAGGLGPLLGDEGSGFWLGKRALAAMPDRFPRGLALRLAHSPETVRKTAALARRVLAWAEQGDPRARALRSEAAAALAELAKESARAAGLRGRLSVCAHGSLLRDPGLRRELVRQGRFMLVEPAHSPEVAAALD